MNTTESKRIPSQIEEKLWLGGVFDSQRKDILIEIGIKYILVAGTNLEMKYPKVNLERT